MSKRGIETLSEAGQSLVKVLLKENVALRQHIKQKNSKTSEIGNLAITNSKMYREVIERLEIENNDLLNTNKVLMSQILNGCPTDNAIEIPIKKEVKGKPVFHTSKTVKSDGILTAKKLMVELGLEDDSRENDLLEASVELLIKSSKSTDDE